MSDRVDKDEHLHSSSLGGLECRISELIALFDTKISAANIAGVSTDMLNRYITGSSSPPLKPIARMCEEQAVSLDWLWYGVGDMYFTQMAKVMAYKMSHTAADMNNDNKNQRFKVAGSTRRSYDSGNKPDLLRELIIYIDRYMTDHSLKTTPEKRGELVSLLYSRFQVLGHLDDAEAAQMIRLATETQ